MLYPVYVHIGDERHAHGVIIPDFPGCFSAADSWEELPARIQEAIELYCEGEDMAIPQPTPLEQLTGHADYSSGAWMLIDIDLGLLETKPVRLNISLPSDLIARIDAHAKAYHMTRSGFLAKAIREAMGREMVS